MPWAKRDENPGRLGPASMMQASRSGAVVPRTKDELLGSLQKGEKTTADLTKITSLHPTVVRRHMADLVREGLVVARLERRLRGRPRTVYSLTLSGRAGFSRPYEAVLGSLTRAALRQVGKRGTRALFQGAARTLAEEFPSDRSTESAVRSLSEIGFQPRLEEVGGRHRVVSRRCPVLRIAQKNPELLCRVFHSALLDGVFPGSRAELLQTMAKGASECVHVLNAPA